MHSKSTFPTGFFFKKKNASCKWLIKKIQRSLSTYFQSHASWQLGNNMSFSILTIISGNNPSLSVVSNSDEKNKKIVQLYPANFN